MQSSALALHAEQGTVHTALSGSLYVENNTVRGTGHYGQSIVRSGDHCGQSIAMHTYHCTVHTLSLSIYFFRCPYITGYMTSWAGTIEPSQVVRPGISKGHCPNSFGTPPIDPDFTWQLQLQIGT